MNCEQVEAIVLDLDRDADADSLERAAAVAHLSHCSRCAALQESWEAAKRRVAGAGRRDFGSACAGACRDAAAAGVSHATPHDGGAAYRGRGGLGFGCVRQFLWAAVSTWNWQQSRHLEADKQKIAAQNYAGGKRVVSPGIGPRLCRSFRLPMIRENLRRCLAPRWMKQKKQRFSTCECSAARLARWDCR